MDDQHICNKWETLKRHKNMWPSKRTGQIVPTDFLEMVLVNSCEYLNLQRSKLKGSLSFQQESELKYLNLSFCKSSIKTFDEIIKSCHSLQKLSLANSPLTVDRISAICSQNSKTLQVLDLSSGQGLMPCPFTGPKMFCAGPHFLCQTKNLFTYCASHKHFVTDKKVNLHSVKLVFVPAQIFLKKH